MGFFKNRRATQELARQAEKNMFHIHPAETDKTVVVFLNANGKDSELGMIEQWLEEKKDEVVRAIEGQKGIWDTDRYIFEAEEMVVELDLQHRPGSIFVFANIMTKDAFEERKKLFKKIFNLDPLENDDFDFKTQASVEEVAKRLGIDPLTDFEVKNPDFKMKPIVQDSEEPVDPRIRELIRLLNMLGFETSFSCQGHLSHDIEEEQPYLGIKANGEVEKIIALVYQWHLRGGNLTRLALSKLSNDIVFIHVNEKRKISEGHKEIDGLTDFLRKQVGEIEKADESFWETVHRYRRRIANLL